MAASVCLRSLPESAPPTAHGIDHALTSVIRQVLAHSPVVLFSRLRAFPYTATFLGGDVERLTGYHSAEFLEKDRWLDSIHPDDRQRVLAEFQSVTGQITIEYRYQHRSGAYIWTQNGVNVMHNEAGEPVELVGYWVDVTNIRSVQTASRDKERLEWFSRALIASQQEERQRLSREIHDDLSQRLAVLMLDISAVRRLSPLRVRTSLDDVEKQLAELCDDLHRIAMNLHPARLDHLGLPAAIESECAVFEKRYGVRAVFERVGALDHLDSEIVIGLFRIFQEALANAARHSRASRVVVSLIHAGGGIRLQVEDNGIGFDPDSEFSKKGLGLITMTERARILNGALSINSHGHTGTIITAYIPDASGR
jgi:PAS domain S-box-containing protein